MIRVFVAPSASSCARTWSASTPRSPESIRTAPRSGPAISTAEPHRLGDVVGVDQQRRALAERVHLGAEGVGLGVVQQREASARWCRWSGRRTPAGRARLEVAAKPATYAARAAATAASSWVRREPISMHGPVARGPASSGTRPRRSPSRGCRSRAAPSRAAPPRRRSTRRPAAASRGSRSRPRRSPRCRRRSGSRRASRASARRRSAASRSTSSSVVAEPERLDRVERPADAGDDAVPPSARAAGAGRARRPSAGRRRRSRRAAWSMVSS